jgi:hypothetical protein
MASCCFWPPERFPARHFHEWSQAGEEVQRLADGATVTVPAGLDHDIEVLRHGELAGVSVVW